MKYINRWALMRNSRAETLTEHTLETAVLAHALATIGNERCGKTYNVDRAAVLGMFHDAHEILTGDMPTPVKYANPVIRKEFAAIEEQSTANLLGKLPEELEDEFSEIFKNIEKDSECHRILKAADRLCAYIKCMEEEKYSNSEFSSARQGIEKKLEETKKALPELGYFMEKFLPAFDLTLDQQQEI
jgi:5'-deoxynucleotidase